MICNICGSANFTPLFEAQDYEHNVRGVWTISRCAQCRLLTQFPLPEPSVIPSFYPREYSAFNSNTLISWMFRVVFAQDAKKIAGLAPPKARILDVGCGNGSALITLRKVGDWELCGLEFDPGAAAEARAQGLDVRQGELTGTDFENGTFDVIRMGHVIEHVLDPLAMLNRAYALLKPGGLLIGETPNTDCADFRIFGRYWGALHVPRHIMIFDKHNLALGLQRAGFHKISMNDGLRTVGWTAGIQNWLAANAGLTVPPTGRVKWYVMLVAAFLPVTIIQSLLGGTATVGFLAYKPEIPPNATPKPIRSSS